MKAGLLVFGMIFFGVVAAYSLFKSRQQAGKARLNRFRTELGSGSFLESVKPNILSWFWALLAFVSLLITVNLFNTKTMESTPAPDPTKASAVVDEPQAQKSVITPVAQSSLQAIQEKPSLSVNAVPAESEPTTQTAQDTSPPRPQQPEPSPNPLPMELR